MLYTFCIVLVLIASVLLILAVLVQSPKSGMAANFGASNQVIGVRQTTDFLEKFTWVMAAAILALSLLATVAMDREKVAESNATSISKDAEALIEKTTRFALPFSAFILTIMGVALSSQKRRGGIGWNIGIGIALAFTYILFLRFSQMFVHTGTLPPAVALWLPNLVFTIIAVSLYRIAPK